MSGFVTVVTNYFPSLGFGRSSSLSVGTVLPIIEYHFCVCQSRADTSLRGIHGVIVSGSSPPLIIEPLSWGRCRCGTPTVESCLEVYESLLLIDGFVTPLFICAGLLVSVDVFIHLCW